MLSLVSYDNSSDSEIEETEETEQRNSKVIVNDNPKPLTSTEANNTNSFDNSGTVFNELFTHLPQPKTQDTNIIEEAQDEFLNKKEEPVEEKPKKKPPVKIGILSLDEFESDEEDTSEPVKKKLRQKGSGLFAMLPAPKCTPLSNTSFVPHVLKKKVNPPARKLPQQVQIKKPKPQMEKESDDEDEIELPETFDEDTWKKVCGKPKRAPKPAQVPQEDPQNIVVESAPDVQQPYTGLDNQAFKELVGSNKKAKENIEVIEINEDEIRPDREEWLKSLTDPNFEPQSNSKKKNGINPTEKSKNHITALAQRALANDKELQLRWAESRHNRRMAAAKYGF